MSTELNDLIAQHGYWLVAAIVAVESMGIPAPGETTLVTAAVYAGTTHRLDILLLIVAAAAGATVGDSLGFLIGRRLGYRWLLRHGHAVRLDVPRIKIGQLLFGRHGGAVVFFGRFIAVLRAAAAFLAGANCMTFRRFFFFNASGAIVWAATCGAAGYVFGERIERLRGPIAIAGFALAACIVLAAVLWIRRNGAALQAEAERALPGPLPDVIPRCAKPAT